MLRCKDKVVVVPSYGRKERPRARLSLCLVIVIVCVALHAQCTRPAARFALLACFRVVAFILPCGRQP